MVSPSSWSFVSGCGTVNRRTPRRHPPCRRPAAGPATCRRNRSARYRRVAAPPFSRRVRPTSGRLGCRADRHAPDARPAHLRGSAGILRRDDPVLAVVPVLARDRMAREHRADRPSRTPGASTLEELTFDDGLLPHGRLRACVRRAQARIPRRIQLRCPMSWTSGRATPSKLALVWCDAGGNERRLTFDDVSRASNRVANRLAARGVAQGRSGGGDAAPHPRVAGRAHRPASSWARFRFPCITMLTERDVAYRVRHSGAAAAITLSGETGKFADAAAFKARIAIGPSCTGWETWLSTDAESEAFARRHRRGRGPRDHVLHVGLEPARQRGCCTPRGGLHAWRVSAWYWLTLSAGDNHVVHGRHRLVEGRHEHLLRSVEPGRGGALPRRSVRCAPPLRAYGTLPRHGVLRGLRPSCAASFSRTCPGWTSRR